MFILALGTSSCLNPDPCTAVQAGPYRLDIDPPSGWHREDPDGSFGATTSLRVERVRSPRGIKMAPGVKVYEQVWGEIEYRQPWLIRFLIST